ncbi:MAG: carotenoid biosynthesis protein [candidate division KSB1 bacterium]|jgi:putative membrane protein|nr:carotenoid biosynthesis protein [candidate division KSB1 bacterium]
MNSVPDTIKRNSENILIGLTYFLLFCGGLWHILDVFQSLMRITAAPLLMGLAIMISIVYLKKHTGTINGRFRISFCAWSAIVIVLCFMIEWAGVETGVIFGIYRYGDTLQPQIFDVPVAIGFAWLCMLLTSAAVVQSLTGRWSKLSPFILAALISFAMVLFDVVMEPAAVKLNYWTWIGDHIPVRNYIAWFVISYLFSMLAIAMEIFRNRLPRIAFHAYWAQLIYFALVILK